MSKMLSLIAVILCALSLAGTLSAADDAAAAPAVPAAAPQTAPKQHVRTSIISGTVVSVDAAAKQVVVKNSEGKMDNLSFEVNDKTNIRKAKKEVTLSEIASGDKVIVAFKHKDDKRIASAIKVRVPKSAAAAPAAQETPAAPHAQQ